MTKTIQSYQELEEERERLEALLKAQRQLIRQDFNDIKIELQPVFGAVKFVGKLTTRDSSNPLVGGAANTVIDLIFRRLVLARAGWITKLVIPYIVKNFSSHIVGDNKEEIKDNIMAFFGRQIKKFRKKKEQKQNAE